MKSIQYKSSIADKLSHLQIHEFAFMDTCNVVFSKEARDLCEKNTCGKYGSSWTCPPGVGSFETCKQRCLAYQHIFVFSTLTKVEDSFDFIGSEKAQILHEDTTRKTAQIFKKSFHNPLILSTKACTLCKTCTYPEAPCRHPDNMYPAVESHGIMVSELTRHAHLHYTNGENTVTFFSTIFFNDK